MNTLVQEYTSSSKPSTLVFTLPTIDQTVISTFQCELRKYGVVTIAPSSRDLTSTALVISLVGTPQELDAARTLIHSYVDDFRSAEPPLGDAPVALKISTNLGSNYDMLNDDNSVLRMLFGLDGDAEATT